MTLRTMGTEIRTWLPKPFIMPASACVVPNGAPILVKFFATVARIVGFNIGVCDGVTDEAEINTCKAALPGGVGRILLLDGRYEYGATTVNLDANYAIILEGQGDSTILDGNNICTPLTIGSVVPNCFGLQVKNLRIEAGNPYGVNIVSLTSGLLENLYISSSAQEALHAAAMNSTLVNHLRIFSVGGLGHGIRKVAGNSNLFFKPYINTQNVGAGTSILIEDGLNDVIIGPDIETFYRGIYLGGYLNSIVGGEMEGGHEYDIVIQATEVIIQNLGANGTGTATSFIQIGPNRIGITIEGCSSWGHTGKTITYTGFNNTRVSFKNNRFQEADTGVLHDDQVERIQALLGELTYNADIILPFERGTGTDDFDISHKGNNVQTVNAPVWGTTSTGKGKLTLNGANQYAWHSLNPFLSAVGSTTWVAVISAGVLEAAGGNREIFFFSDAGGDNRVFLYKHDVFGVDFYITSGGVNYHTGDNLIGWALNDILVFICTFNNTTGIGTLYCNGRKIASFSGGVAPLSADSGLWLGSTDLPANFWLGDYLCFIKLSRCLTEAEVSRVTRNLAEWVGLTPISIPEKRQFLDLFMDALAANATYIRNAQDLSGAIPINFVIDNQPDIPRNLQWSMTHGNITAYTMEIVGTNAKGEAVTETWTEAAGWSGVTNNAFARITSIKMTARTGSGVGDTMNVGISNKFGLSNKLASTADVYKIKKNNADAVPAAAQVNITYDTYDMSVIGVAGGDDFTIWFRSNANIVK